MPNQTAETYSFLLIRVHLLCILFLLSDRLFASVLNMRAHIVAVYSSSCVCVNASVVAVMWFHLCLCGFCVVVSHCFSASVPLSSSWLHNRRPAVYVADRRPGANGRHRSATV